MTNSRGYKMEAIERYKEIMDNYTFFNNNNFVIETIDYLWEYIYIIVSHLEQYKNIKPEKLSTSSIENSIELAQKYLDYHNINITISEELNNGSLIFKEGSKKQNEYNGSTIGGNSRYDEKQQKAIATVILDYTTIDSLIIIHELSHNSNQPKHYRSIVSNILTEAYSYSNELISADELFEADDKFKYLKLYALTIYNMAYSLYPIYKIILTYKHQGNITENDYSKEFKDKDYHKNFKSFERYIE